jgi:putative membrane-bound dehydrogenase-like protein
MPRLLLAATLLAACSLLLAGDNGLPPGIKDTQNPKDIPPTPQEAVRLFKPADGFNVSLFAGEPDVRQPSAIAFDDRGRVWVAECYSYPKWTSPEEGRDRILVFEDTNGDGKFDKRTVFWDRAHNLTGLQVGFGGVWACCAPHLLFIPDKDGDLVPDGKPEVVLDGWTLKAGHNIYNGLIWGPDGWLYGCHGITAESLVGRPGTPDDKRTRLNCSIWRYHPTRKTFEVVCNGTTNPWGLDFDDHGEAFFINCVIGHLWHMIPGAHYKRMYGLDYNRHAYDLIDATSDHLHWGGGHWTSSRGGKGIHNEAGGGHAHCGLMAYLGDNWPEKYRNGLFMCNIHGNRINHDIPLRKGCSYTGRHAADFLTSDNPWFRGVTLTYGPDGAVLVTDWCDLGECHDHDGVHRSSGRIYRVAYGKTKPVKGLDLSRKTDSELVALQLHRNDFYVRRARRLLQERAAAGASMGETHRGLRKIFEDNPEVPRKLRAMWALHVTGGAPAPWLAAQLGHADEHVRAWAVRLLCEQGKPSDDVLRKFASMAAEDASGLVRLELASVLQRLPARDRFPIASRLAAHAEDADDRCQPLMIWYGIEPAVTVEPVAALKLASGARIPRLRQFVARRLTEADDRAALEALVGTLGKVSDVNVQRDLIAGLREGLKGRKSVKMPSGWKSAQSRLASSTSADVRQSARLLAILFDDPQALAELRQTIADPKAPAQERATALQALVEKGVPDLTPVLYKLLDDRGVRGPALRALAAVGPKDAPQAILRIYSRLGDSEKRDAMTTLASRPAYALALLDAVERKQIPRSDISAFTARQLMDLRNRQVTTRLEKVWGQVRQTPGEKKKLIEKYKRMLTTDVLAKADRPNGRLIFSRTCQQCHTLFGEGAKIGPDLTGSNRADLHYVLENSVDPSAVIGRDYQLNNIFTKKGQLVAGIIVEETERALTVQTPTERVVLSKADIEDRQVAKVSMMPEGQLEKLTRDELRDLVGYLASKEQVPLPGKKE